MKTTKQLSSGGFISFISSKDSKAKALLTIKSMMTFMNQSLKAICRQVCLVTIVTRAPARRLPRGVSEGWQNSPWCLATYLFVHLVSYLFVCMYLYTYSFICHINIIYIYMSCHIISYHIMSYHVISYYIILYHIVSYHIYHIILYIYIYSNIQKPRGLCGLIG